MFLTAIILKHLTILAMALSAWLFISKVPDKKLKIQLFICDIVVGSLGYWGCFFYDEYYKDLLQSIINHSLK